MTTGLVYILYVLFAAAGAAVLLAMPRPDGGYVRSGFVVGVGALAGLLALCSYTFMAPHASNIFFYFFAAVAVLAAGRVVTHPNPTYSAVYFGLVVLSVAVLLVMERAEFLAVALVIIYAGAILVTYAFVIMLAQQSGAAGPDVRSREPFMAVLVSFVVMGAIAGQVGEVNRLPANLPTVQTAPAVMADVPVGSKPTREVGNTLAVGQSMFDDYVVVVQLAGLLLLVAMVGAIAVSRKQIPVEEVGPPPPAPGTIGRQVPPF
ncbi:MAG TPA: NADH-quinone oxidoreductase subunit J [Phycisphaerae bacterium]|nr:NADH-quinone oxidoreductase subunit J [Phycisphaerae bacterium]